ncbi:MAG TPA: bifunctional 5,10-methylenetetrahydrofolate dehydrogenase/5,10-methenyltetrahydrofolate cyclohydrolase [Anaerolineae bacterium]
MTALILRGKPVADKIRADIAPSIEGFRNDYGIAPTLAVVRVGNRPEAVSYASSIDRIFTQSSMGFQMHVLPDDVTNEQLITRLHELTRMDDVHGILLQRPLPHHLDLKVILREFPVAKDVEGITPSSIGDLALDMDPQFPASTPSATVEILSHYGIPIEGKRALVIGRSNILGLPMALLLLQANATVIVAHSHSRDLAQLARQAELIVAAAGRPKLVTSGMVAPGAIVIDFGVNIQSRPPVVTGDVDFDAVKETAAAITPVPGGTGPVTTMILMRNTVHAAQRQARQIGSKGRIKWLPILKSPNRRR